MPAPILCYGEILWDCLPAGLFLGGAPANVGYHLACLGLDARLVSAVGRDTLGEEVLRRLRHWKLDTSLIARHARRPTGTVIAELADSGDAHYRITPDVAWDRIPATAPARRTAAAASALVFGTLALRDPANRVELDRLLAALPASALRVLDVNLRAPHDNLDLARELASRATLLKLNATEASRLVDAGDTEFPGAEEAHARALAANHGCALVVITAGARGAGLLRDGQTWTWETGQEVHVADTIGSGDGFLASLLWSLLTRQDSDREILARACRHGEWIATKHGATPAY